MSFRGHIVSSEVHWNSLLSIDRNLQSSNSDLEWKIRLVVKLDFRIEPVPLRGFISR